MDTPSSRRVASTSSGRWFNFLPRPNTFETVRFELHAMAIDLGCTEEMSHLSFHFRPYLHSPHGLKIFSCKIFNRPWRFLKRSI